MALRGTSLHVEAGTGPQLADDPVGPKQLHDTVVPEVAVSTVHRLYLDVYVAWARALVHADVLTHAAAVTPCPH